MTSKMDFSSRYGVLAGWLESGSPSGLVSSAASEHQEVAVLPQLTNQPENITSVLRLGCWMRTEGGWEGGSSTDKMYS